MEYLYQNIDLSSQLLHAIWLRKPIIISSIDNDKIDKHIDTLLSFIPDYRLLIACGKIPKRVIYQKSNIKILDLKDKQLLAKSIISAFEEENVATIPLQLICFNTGDWFFAQILNRINQGWIAITSLSKDEIARLLRSEISFSFNHDLITFFFVNNSSGDSIFEQRLIKTLNNKPESIIRLLLQKKMSEIRYVGQALIKELEQSNMICQTEIEAMYDIDNASFNKSVEVLKSETRLDISKYIDFAPQVISSMLNRMIKLNGVLIAICLNQKKVLGIVRNERLTFNDLQLFSSYYALLSELEKEYNFGKTITLSFEFDTNEQLLFIKIPRVSDFEDIVFAFILEPSVSIILFLFEIDNIFKEV